MKQLVILAAAILFVAATAPYVMACTKDSSGNCNATQCNYTDSNGDTQRGLCGGTACSCQAA